MKTHRISRTIVATMVAVSLAGSGNAWADRKDGQRAYGKVQSGHQDKRSYGNKQGGRQDKRSYGNSRGGHQDKRSYGNSRGGHQDKRSHGNSRGGHQGKYYAYNKHKKNKYKPHHYKGNTRHYDNRGYGGRSYYYYDDDDDNDDNLLFGLLFGGLVGYAISNAQQDNTYGYDSYPQTYTPQQAETVIYEAETRSEASCLQEREYQSKVIVGGRSVDAYGTACLEPDGSWSRGPAKLASF